MYSVYTLRPVPCQGRLGAARWHFKISLQIEKKDHNLSMGTCVSCVSGTFSLMVMRQGHFGVIRCGFFCFCFFFVLFFFCCCCCFFVFFFGFGLFCFVLKMVFVCKRIDAKLDLGVLLYLCLFGFFTF